jgi:hypothetical protein
VNGYDPARHGEPGTPLPPPGPGGDEDQDDGDGIPVIDPPGPADLPRDDYTPRHGPGFQETELPPDPPPAAPRDIPAPRGKHARVTSAVRRDVEAKFGLMLEIPGRVWAVRDPWCGGAFLQQVPDIRSAGVELICQSPDLVAWFTGTGGGFMLWLNLVTALQPVALTAWAHHVTHAIGADAEHEQAGPVPAGAYAA